ncbi:Formin-like protein 14 [Camellia lanceoleosa]|uniref:Formin-like protein 14 n=1 Tax=Camellia lanceoleosa TaxID=1840588 RepID=A0ACC0HAG1_9ERIC|nr:Formin-like protein 14 [Camellia lanceoleosa]
MDATDELTQLTNSMCQASTLLANEDVNENSSSSRRPSTFLNVVALGNTPLSIELGPGILGNKYDGIQNYNGTNNMLGKCEHVNDLRCNLNTINAAAREVKESAKLRQVMQTILTIRNALNQVAHRMTFEYLFSGQVDPQDIVMGQIVLCGLRNGAICFLHVHVLE